MNGWKGEEQNGTNMKRELALRDSWTLKKQYSCRKMISKTFEKEKERLNPWLKQAGPPITRRRILAEKHHFPNFLIRFPGHELQYLFHRTSDFTKTFYSGLSLRVSQLFVINLYTLMPYISPFLHIDIINLFVHIPEYPSFLCNSS